MLHLPRPHRYSLLAIFVLPLLTLTLHGFPMMEECQPEIEVDQTSVHWSGPAAALMGNLNFPEVPTGPIVISKLSDTEKESDNKVTALENQPLHSSLSLEQLNQHQQSDISQMVWPEIATPTTVSDLHQTVPQKESGSPKAVTENRRTEPSPLIEFGQGAEPPHHTDPFDAGVYLKAAEDYFRTAIHAHRLLHPSADSLHEISNYIMKAVSANKDPNRLHHVPILLEAARNADATARALALGRNDIEFPSFPEQNQQPIKALPPIIDQAAPTLLPSSFNEHHNQEAINAIHSTASAPPAEAEQPVIHATPILLHDPNTESANQNANNSTSEPPPAYLRTPQQLDNHRSAEYARREVARETDSLRKQCWEQASLFYNQAELYDTFYGNTDYRRIAYAYRIAAEADTLQKANILSARADILFSQHTATQCRWKTFETQEVLRKFDQQSERPYFTVAAAQDYSRLAKLLQNDALLIKQLSWTADPVKWQEHKQLTQQINTLWYSFIEPSNGCTIF